MPRIPLPLRTVFLVAPVIVASALADDMIKDVTHDLVPMYIHSGQFNSPLTCVIDPFATPCHQGTIPCGAFHCNMNDAVSVLHFNLPEDCCEWEIGSCSEFNTDTWLILDGPGELFVEGPDDPDLCEIECTGYSPDVLNAETTGVTCLPAGNYALFVYGYGSWSYDPDARTNGGGGLPEGCSEILQDLPYEVCFDFCSGQGDVVQASERPVSSDLQAVYPNPFNPAATIRWNQPETGPALLVVHDVSGARIATLVEGMTEAGGHETVFDGSGLASGIYFLRLETPGGVSGARMILAK